MDHWTLGLFLKLFLDFFWTIFWTILLGKGGRPLGLREGWDAVCHYSGRGGRQVISTQGGVGGGCISNCYWLMEFLVDHTIYFERFLDWLFFMSEFLRWVVTSLYFFFHTNAKLALKHSTKIAIGNFADSRFRSSTFGSRVCLLSRLVPALNDTHWLAWIIHQLLRVSLCE